MIVRDFNFVGVARVPTEAIKRDRSK